MGEIKNHLESAVSGNRNAFAEVVAAYRDMAMAVARRRLKNEALAEEAVQEAFLAAYLNLTKLEEPGSFGSWLRVILSRNCSRILRKENRSREHPIDHEIPNPEAIDPCELYTSYLDRERVRKILAGLGGICREACILRYVHGLPYSEISETLGVPLGTVKRRLYEARDLVVREYNRQGRPAIRVGHMPISDHLLAMVAHHRHDQRSYGMQLRRFLSWGKLVRCLENASLDAAFVMAPLAMALRNAGLGIKYVLDGHHDGSAVTVRASSGGTLDNGTRMALPHAISTHRLFLHSMFGTAGLGKNDNGPGDLSTLFINPSYVINSLLKHEIDGFFCSEPWSSKSAAQGAGRVVARSGELAPGHICCILVVRDDFAQSQPDLLSRFIRSLTAAGEYISSHPWESAAIQARYTGIDRGVVDHILTKRYITYQDLAPDTGRAKRLMSMALEAGVLSKPCDLANFVCPDFAGP
jgi:NitT/TauT family transport system substrate-binding protein